KANLARTRHVREDIFRRTTHEILRGHPVGLATYSPDCRYFSTARGGAPTSASVRALPWSVVWHAKHIKNRILIVENVRELQFWGPLMDSRNSNGQLLYVLKPDQKHLKETRFIRAWKKLTKGKGGTKAQCEKLP